MAEPWPDGLCPQQMSWGCVYNSRAFTSTLSNAQQIVSYPGAYWTCSMSFSALTRTQERLLTSLIGRLQGMAGTIQVPATTRQRADNIGAPVLAAAASTNAYSLSVSGLTANGIVFRAGDYITLEGVMFEVVADATAMGGAAVVTVNKRVRAGIPAGTAIEYQVPWCEMRLTGDVFSVDLQPLTCSATIELREAF
ncbi:hypothetical protein [Azorhizophilus paspali]|uniref:Uncharacterized protein n=2 Tax=Azorhizophilus paspali TaxID=69963 RepID=A0ABV6SMH4_AZOPA